MSDPRKLSSTTPVAYNVRIDNENTAHPRIHITLPASFLDPPQTKSHQCEPFLLIRVPPGLFIDPFTFPIIKTSPSDSLRDRKKHFIPTSSIFSHNKHVDDTPPHAMIQDRLVIKGIEMLNGSEQSKYDFTKVELERGIGYSIQSEAEEKSLGTRKENAQMLIGEYNAYIISLFRFKSPSLLGKQHQASVGGDANSAEQDLEIEPKGQQIELDIPLHTRYPIPIGAAATGLEELTSFNWSKLVESIVWPAEGSYYKALVEYPHASWKCKGDGLVAVDSGLYESVSQTELLAPMHTHLRFPEPSPKAGNENQFYILLPPSGTSREPFRIQIPLGQADLAIVLQIITTGFLLFASLFIISKTSIAFKKVRKSENL